MKQFGGLKLKHVRKQGFQAVSDMLRNPKSKLEILTYLSYKGFVFVLNVQEEFSEYFTLHEGRFDKPVTSFILKFALIKKYITELPPLRLSNRVVVKKATESKQSFFEEAKLQQHVWKKSISEGKPAICPSIANFSLFDTIQSTNLLQFLQTKLYKKIFHI